MPAPKKSLRPKSRPRSKGASSRTKIADRMKKGKMPMVLDYNTSRALTTEKPNKKKK